MQRSNSSASGYYTSTLSNTTNYIPDLSGRPKPAVRHDGHVHPPSITSHPNFSTQSLGGNAHLKSGPVSYRPTVQHSQASASTASVATFGIDPLRLCKKTSKAPVSNPCRAHMEVVSADSMSRVNHPLPFKGGEFGYRTTEVQDTRTFKTNAATHQGKPSGSRIVRP
ncbi:hypothetical protein BDQ17DRAFT_1421035 [Cyathus striatus]|nr:hypothetical protein BDQ17DRAFT_1421035 [Cyathus striatus]